MLDMEHQASLDRLTVLLCIHDKIQCFIFIYFLFFCSCCLLNFEHTQLLSLFTAQLQIIKSSSRAEIDARDVGMVNADRKCHFCLSETKTDHNRGLMGRRGIGHPTSKSRNSCSTHCCFFLPCFPLSPALKPDFLFKV